MTITFLAPDGVAITAQQMRQANSVLFGNGAGRVLGGRSGFRADTASTIFTATSTTWTLNPCSAMIDPAASTYQGMYAWATDAAVTGAVTAANATNPRKDIVYIQINDSSAGDGSGALTANVLYLAGTPAPSPVAPALPARSFLVGTITVPQSGGGSPTVVMNPARFVAAGGILPVFSQAERDALTKYDGLAVRRMDVAGRLIETWDGTSWFRERDGVPTRIQSGSCTVSVTSGTAAGSLAVTFPTAFSSAPNSVVLTKASVSGSASTMRLLQPVATGISATGFTANLETTTGANVGATFNVVCYWVAVQN